MSFQLWQDQALSASPAQNWDRVVRGSPARRVAGPTFFQETYLIWHRFDYHSWDFLTMAQQIDSCWHLLPRSLLGQLRLLNLTVPEAKRWKRRFQSWRALFGATLLLYATHCLDPKSKTSGVWGFCSYNQACNHHRSLRDVGMFAVSSSVQGSRKEQWGPNVAPKNLRWTMDMENP